MADKRDVRSALRAYEQPSMLQGAWDEISGAFARYGRRSGAQRDASLAMLNQAVDPNTDPLTGAGMKALGLAGLITHPLAFFPTGDEWRERTRNAGNTGRMGQAIGGMLGDLPSIVDPHLIAGGGALAMAPLIGKMANKADDFNEGRVAYRGLTKPYDPNAKGYYQSFTSSADDAREYGENVIAAHLRLGNNLPVSAGGNNFNAIPLGSLPEDLAAKVRQRHGGNTATTDEIAHAARESGYDSVTFQNVHDSKWGERGKTGEARTIDMVFDNNNIRPLQDFKFEQPAQKKVALSAEEDNLLSELFKDDAWKNLTEATPKTRKGLLTQSYKETLPDGTERWVPGTMRSNPTTAPRFEPSMSLADIRRYIEQFGEPPPPRAKGEIVTGKRKDVYPDGTVTPVPGLLRTKRPDSK